MAKNKRLRQISHQEAESGIFIDFEGTGTDPSSFVGILYKRGTELLWDQVVFEEALRPVVIHYKSEKLRGGAPPRMGEFTKTFKDLRERAETDDRRLFAFSEREIDELRERLPKEEINWWEENLLNVRKYAVKWKRKNHPDVVFESIRFRGGKNSLDNFLNLIGFDVPPILGPGNSAQRIRYVRDMLNKWNGDVNKLTNTAKGKWTKALNHNWYDCIGTRDLMIEVHKEACSKVSD